MAMFERVRARLRRREFLGGVAGTTAALAGCEALTSDTDRIATESNEKGVPSHGHATDGLHPPPEYGLGFRGARHPAWLVEICPEDCTTSATAFEPVTAGPTYGFVPVPAGMIPVLRTVIVLHNDTEGEHTALRLTTPGRRDRNLDPLIAVRTDGSTDVNRLYEEIYLNEIQFGTSFKSSLGDATLEAHLRVTGGVGTLRSESTAALVYEVVDGGTGGDRGGDELGGRR